MHVPDCAYGAVMCLKDKTRDYEITFTFNPVINSNPQQQSLNFKTS